MADPATVSCPADAWTKVASAVTTGQVWILDTTPRYVQTYRTAGNPAPTDDALAGPFQGESMLISAGAPIDVYIKPRGSAGKVRVDL